ncbi:MAG TPA: hypothetical protein VGV15_15060, partial [Terriglobales bacterium]|nr:hypothetical protein [Terriglobales bacterium]
PEIPVVGSVATTRNCTVVVGPDVVINNPLVEEILTLSMEEGFVLQVTESVMSNSCPPAVPVATNRSALPYGILESPSAVLTFIEVNPLIVTVMVALPVTVSDEPDIMAFPGPTPVTNPEALTDATVGVSLFHWTPDFRCFCDPSL